MKDVKQFVSRYAVFVLVVGVLIIVVMNSSINNLPSPFLLAPGQATREYYTPLRVYRFIRFLGIITTLTGAFFLVKNVADADKEGSGKFNSITSAISESLSELVTEIKQNPENKDPSLDMKNSTGLPADMQRDQNIGGVSDAKISQKIAKSYIIEVKRQKTNAGMEYVYIDENGYRIIGIHNILTHLAEKGYRIINTIQTTTNDTEVIEIILEA